ncbi:hypothetical protein H8K35_10565 [Undibacterium sp. LX40W]|uniref:Lipoprotein n=1 Tax=Undibacterium nitidum TaxID=2762298 RepID=A0A923HQ01_9BURK|nr:MULTISPECIES: hypothetical protein [Undibacterium]MBC3881901.1 hypothetical protein [Undibacterium nitidum]MBC3892102.1 hypothetical protein [Undibacterium sp. LX40W]
MPVFFKKQILVSFSVALLASLGGCITLVNHIPGSIAIKVEPVLAEGQLLLQCEASSSGKCYFLIGEQYDVVYEVVVGESKPIPAPKQATPFCATFSNSFRKLCNKNTFISPDGNQLIITQTWHPR